MPPFRTFYTPSHVVAEFGRSMLVISAIFKQNCGLGGQWQTSQDAAAIERFYRLLAVCRRQWHTFLYLKNSVLKSLKVINHSIGAFFCLLDIWEWGNVAGCQQPPITARWAQRALVLWCPNTAPR